MVDKCWYVDDQKSAARNPAQRFTIYYRERFILGVIKDYQRNNKGKILTVLDAGCGDGVFLEKMADKIKDAKIYGIDYNPLRIERARSSFKDRNNIIVDHGDVKNLNFSDGFFDIVLANQVLEHIYEEQIALKELYRVLKSGGILIVGVPNEGCLLAQLRNNILQSDIKKTTDHVHFYTYKRIRDVIVSAGFTIVKVWRQSFFIPHLVLGGMISRFLIGYKFLDFMGRYIFPSQCASLYLVCKK